MSTGPSATVSRPCCGASTMAIGWRATMTAPSRATGPHPIVVFGNAEQKARWLPRLVRDQDQCAFGITEPDAGLNTTTIKTFAEKVPGG